MTEQTSIIVAICTFKRNEPLANLLETLVACAEDCRSKASIGVVVVDDTVDGQARSVAEAFAGRFEKRLVYRISGKQNISHARNLAVETAMQLGEWVAMTDDDCEPRIDWLSALLEVQEKTSGDAVSGLMVRRVPPGSPAWITKAPFLTLGAADFSDCQKMDVGFTNNSMVSSAWLLDHPNIRFDPKLGNLGGEDMAFFRAARAAGLKIYFSVKGYIYENEPASRMTLKYQLGRFYWYGNSSYVTMLEHGQSPMRLFVHGAANFCRALLRPFGRLARGQAPQLRFTLASLFLSCGVIAGCIGVRVRHN